MTHARRRKRPRPSTAGLERAVHAAEAEARKHRGLAASLRRMGDDDLAENHEAEARSWEKVAADRREKLRRLR